MQTCAVALGTRNAANETHRPIAHLLALGVSENVHDVFARTPERSVVAIVGTAWLRLDQDGRLLVRVQQPIPVLFLEFVPRRVDVDLETTHDASKVGPLPRPGPGRDRSVTNAQRGIRNEEVLGDVVHHTKPVALRAGAGRSVGRERFGPQKWSP